MTIPFIPSFPLMLETIAIFQGKIQNSSYHFERMKRSGVNDEQILIELTNITYDSTIKCRLLYRDYIESISVENYQLRPLNRMK